MAVNMLPRRRVAAKSRATLFILVTVAIRHSARYCGFVAASGDGSNLVYPSQQAEGGFYARRCADLEAELQQYGPHSLRRLYSAHSCSLDDLVRQRRIRASRASTQHVPSLSKIVRAARCTSTFAHGH